MVQFKWLGIIYGFGLGLVFLWLFPNKIYSRMFKKIK